MARLPGELYNRCRNVLLQCNEFNSDAALRTVFVVKELSPFRSGLPEAESKSERVDKCLAFLVDKHLSDGRPLLPLFLATLRDKYQEADALHGELGKLTEALQVLFEPLPESPAQSTHDGPDTVTAYLDVVQRRLSQEFDSPAKVISLLIMVLLTPLIYSFVYEAFLLLIEIDFYSVECFVYGFLAGTLIYLILRNNANYIYFELSRHARAHAIVALVLRRGIREYVVSPPTTYVLLRGPTNFLIRLAPYYLPIFTIPLLVIKPFVFSSIHEVIDFLIGITLAFHFTSLLQECTSFQPDIADTGIIFSFGVMYFLNVIFLVLALFAVLNNYSSMLNYFQSSFARTLDSYKMGWLIGL